MFRKDMKRTMLRAAIASLVVPITLNAQTNEGLLEFRFPELASYLNAFEIVQAAILEEVILTNDSPQSEIGKGLLRDSLKELSKAEGSHYHTAGNHLAMLGPYRVFESRATPGLVAMLRRETDHAATVQALAVSEVLPLRAVQVLQRGQEFMEQILEIYIDGGIMDKKTAVDTAIANYLSNDTLSVPTKPKNSALLSEHEYAYAFRVGFPEFSGITWASQWLYLATLEALVTAAGDDLTAEEGIDLAQRLYVEKIARLHNTMASLPSDIPTVPVIAPNVYSAHPEAAVIIDNLSSLKIVLGDILAYPDLADRPAAIEELLAQFTDKNAYLEEEDDYLTFVLRGGIFNQGGPANGSMAQSERNQSRSSLESQHISNLPMNNRGF